VSTTVSDFDRAVTEFVHRGIEYPTMESIPEAGRKAPVVDPDGNTVTFIPVSAKSD
jgi:hypothetical protein